jgi:hypothetical protein
LSARKKSFDLAKDLAGHALKGRRILVAEPYRDDTDALGERLSALESELRELQRTAERRDAVQQEIERLRTQLNEARARGPLEDLRIASPCNARWEDMVGDERVRHCAHCDKDVYLVAGMTRTEALALIHEQVQSGLCLRMFKRADGTVLTADCPVGERKKRVRRLMMVGAGAAAGLAAGYAALEAGSPTLGEVHAHPRSRPVVELDRDESHAVTMGSIAIPQVAPPPVSTGSAAPARR